MDSKEISSGYSQDAVAKMVAGFEVSTPILVGLQKGSILNSSSNSASFVEYTIFDDNFSTRAIVLSDEGIKRGCWLISIDGYITSEANGIASLSAPFLFITSYKIVMKQRKSHDRPSVCQEKLKMRSKRPSSFLSTHAPFLSIKDLGGCDVLTPLFGTPVNEQDLSAAQVLADHHHEMKSLEKLQAKYDPSRQREDAAHYHFSNLRQYAEEQIERQKSILGCKNSTRKTEIHDQYNKALQLALIEHITEPFNGTMLQKVHAVLCKGQAHDAGLFRTEEFGSYHHVPETIELLCRSIRDLESRLLPRGQDSHSVMSAIIFASAIFFGIIEIRPFSDGNERLAKLMSNWALTKGGFPLIINWFGNPLRQHECQYAIKKTRRNLLLVSKGNANSAILLNAFRLSGAMLPLVRLVVERLQTALAEFKEIKQEDLKAKITPNEHVDQQTAREFREEAAAGSCVICLEEQPNMATLCCGTAVHIKCMTRWLQHSESCPQCRTELSSVRKPKVQGADPLPHRRRTTRRSSRDAPGHRRDAPDHNPSVAETEHTDRGECPIASREYCRPAKSILLPGVSN